MIISSYIFSKLLWLKLDMKSKIWLHQNQAFSTSKALYEKTQ